MTGKIQLGRVVTGRILGIYINSFLHFVVDTTVVHISIELAAPKKNVPHPHLGPNKSAACMCVDLEGMMMVCVSLEDRTSSLTALTSADQFDTTGTLQSTLGHLGVSF